MKLVDFKMNRAEISKQLLKNPKLKPILLQEFKRQNKSDVDGEIKQYRKRIVAKQKKLTPEQRARAVMRNAKSPGQKAFARYLFSQLGMKE